MNPLTQIKNTQKISAQEVAAGLSENASWHAKYKDSAYVFAGGLGYDLTEGDLLAIFAQYGELMDVNLVRDQTTGKSKGFAFLAYEDQRSTVLAVDNLNGARVASRIIRVDHVADYKRKKEEDEEERNAAREERGVCYAFQRGECTRGNACRFSHDEQRNSKSWGPKDLPHEQPHRPTDKFQRSSIGPGTGQRPGHVDEGSDAGPAMRGVASQRASHGAPVSAGGKGGAEGAELPWEGGLFSMLAGEVDTTTSTKEARKQKERRDGREEKRKASGAEIPKERLERSSKRPKSEERKEGSRGFERHGRQEESATGRGKNGSTAERGALGKDHEGTSQYEKRQSDKTQDRSRSALERDRRRHDTDDKDYDKARSGRDRYQENGRGQPDVGRGARQSLHTDDREAAKRQRR